MSLNIITEAEVVLGDKSDNICYTVRKFNDGSLSG